jgi:hypothetical protein
VGEPARVNANPNGSGPLYAVTTGASERRSFVEGCRTPTEAFAEAEPSRCRSMPPRELRAPIGERKHDTFDHAFTTKSHSPSRGGPLRAEALPRARAPRREHTGSGERAIRGAASRTRSFPTVALLIVNAEKSASEVPDTNPRWGGEGSPAVAP